MNHPVTIRPYRGTDEEALIALWNAAMTHDRITASVFRTRVLLDSNFDPRGLLLAEKDGQLVGFLLSIVRQVPLFLQGLEPDTGWITAFGVSPFHQRHGIGTQLFSAAVSRLGRMGHTKILISPYTPNYFIPGIDTEAYPAAFEFLKKQGWKVTSTPISMRAELTGFQIPASILDLEHKLQHTDSVRVRPVTSSDLPQLMPFIAQNFGWDWYRFAQEYLLELFGAGSDEICVLVATQDEHIVGYCQQRRERFGPFGVLPEMRSMGIGRLLLFRCLSEMLARGFHCSWFLWTGKDAARLYSLAGFKQVRQFAVMRLDLE
ncbi:MAG TPA: GNAT family N-acetyltransferase [Anaerolineaceae bacterium]